MLISIRFLAAALAFAGLASCTSDTTGVVPTSGSLRATSPPVTPSGGATASPSIQAIEAACAALDVQVKILAKALHGKQPITDNVEGEFALAARQIQKAARGLQGTDAASRLARIADVARGVGNYTGTNIGDLLDLVSGFAHGSRRFNQTYCQTG